MTKASRVIAIVLAVVLILLLVSLIPFVWMMSVGAGIMNPWMMNPNMMGSGMMMGNCMMMCSGMMLMSVVWLTIPIVLILALGVLLGWVIFQNRPRQASGSQTTPSSLQ
jgi:hypothetical protein